ncbi:hypothetical protein CkaCkLH20_01759 [Colletotrichum karsti]|uniref:Siderophore biosynthesis enzyme n=1 Tax=Colletotrichum karsti TaxID=1095194 RepID=A0A9P6IE57_9PEZI|nr:uncharacterized protein CkaCkLH20_01759 [Colletotrichum karsti]KAF9880717.1 hypothetical protein CkaCkLH20_01759 [Colletotrichum karsti]
MSFRILATVAVMASAALAKTDLTGCTSSDSVVTPSGGGTPYATRVYFVPGTGEICAPLDCGGGRAPPKTTVPGCAAYVGTDTYSPSFIALKTASAAGGYQTTQISLTAAPSAQATASASAAADSSSMSGSQSGDYNVQTGSDTLMTVSTSAGDAPTAAAGNGTMATTTSRSRATGSNGLNGTSSQTSVPNAAAAGVSNMYGLMAGVALGAAALL